MNPKYRHVSKARDISTNKWYVIKNIRPEEIRRNGIAVDADNFVKIGKNPNFYPANAIIFGPTRKNVHKCIIITISALTNKLWNVLSV